MENKNKLNIAIIGGGLVGSLVACYMARQGHDINLYEYRDDIRRTPHSRGRTINLSLSSRGRVALSNIGLEEKVLGIALPLKGRMIHYNNGTLKSSLYDPHQNQCIYSVDRNHLNEILLTETERYSNVSIHNGYKLSDANLESGLLKFYHLNTSDVIERRADLIIGADGAYSTVRKCMMLRPHFNYSQSYIKHGYLELTIPANVDEDTMNRSYLHVWPRDDTMIIAMPNKDYTWSVTLFMTFDAYNTITSACDLIEYFKFYYTDVIHLIGVDNLVRSFFSSKLSPLLSIKCKPYHVSDRAVILGDAAHAMVPFYGQGMNAGFEDCYILDNIMRKYPITEALHVFTNSRWSDAHAICDLALNNFEEISSLVTRPSYRIRRIINLKLHTLFGNRWIPHYQAVCFTNKSYSDCVKLKQLQDQIINTVVASALSIFIIILSVIFCKNISVV